MYGKNPITKQELRDDGALYVHSVWPTIQGEGPDAGRPAVFVRLQGCNLRCFWCDTEFDSGTLRSVTNLAGEVVMTAANNNIKLVVITGGEPFLQNFAPLVEACNNARLSVSVETAGTLYSPAATHFFPGNPWGNLIVCSPKTPQVNKELLPYIGAYKYLIRAAELSLGDGLPVYSTQQPDTPSVIFRPPEMHSFELVNRVPIYVQPVDENDGLYGATGPKSLHNLRAAVASCRRYGYRLSLQIHKLVGVP